MIRILRSVALGLGFLTATACGRPTDLPARYQIPLRKPAGDWIQAMRPVMLLADNQTQHLYGKPFWMRSAIAPSFARTAIAPFSSLE